MTDMNLSRVLARLKGGRTSVVRRKLRTRLLVTLIPTSLIVLALMGGATYWVSSEFISLALERNSRMHAVTTAHAVQEYLGQCRRHLLCTPRAEPWGLGNWRRIWGISGR
jgi:hypothetical protein